MPHRNPPEAPGQSHMKPGDVAARGTPATGEALCPVCGGSGKVNNQPCEECDGTGIVTEGIGGA